MQVKLSPEQRDALAAAGSTPIVELVDSETNEAYFLIRADLFERLRHVFSGDDFDVRQAYPLMDAAARAAGWDHADEDVYDDLDPRRST
jgi:hypothetical protein